MKMTTQTVSSPASQGLSVKDMTLIAMSAVLIAICSWITLPIGAVPFTLQTFGVFAVTVLIGWKRGLIAVCLYILLGAVGIPVFSGFKAGLGVLLGTTGGYIIGFIAVPLVYLAVTKLLGEHTAVKLLGLFLGDVIVFVFGTVWFIQVYSAANGAVSVGQAMAWCVIPFIIPDLAKMVLAVLISPRIARAANL